jgi:hypothetical protein
VKVSISCPGGLIELKGRVEFTIGPHTEEGKEGQFFIFCEMEGETVRLVEELPTKKRANWLMFRLGTELNRAEELGGGVVEWEIVRRPARARRNVPGLTDFSTHVDK